MEWLKIKLNTFRIESTLEGEGGIGILYGVGVELENMRLIFT